MIWGCGWTGIDTPILYWFGSGAVASPDSSIGAFTGAAWSAGEKSAFETALANYSVVCNLSFTEAASGNAGAADIVWWLAPESAMGAGALGLHEVIITAGKPPSKMNPPHHLLHGNRLG